MEQGIGDRFLFARGPSFHRPNALALALSLSLSLSLCGGRRARVMKREAEQAGRGAGSPALTILQKKGIMVGGPVA